jgi:hypothetical protein
MDAENRQAVCRDFPDLRNTAYTYRRTVHSPQYLLNEYCGAVWARGGAYHVIRYGVVCFSDSASVRAETALVLEKRPYIHI